MLTEEHENLFVIGDQSQSIYRFRGAMPDSLRLLHQARPHAAMYRLGRNYRSTQVIVAAGQAIIASASAKDREYSTDIWTENAQGDAIRLVTAYDQDDEAGQIADAIAADIRSGGKPGDWAILYRVNAQSRAVEQALIRRRVRHQIIGGVSFFERAEVKDVLAYLRLIANPTDDLAVQRACNTPTRGLGDKTVEQLVAAAKDQERPLLEIMFEQRDSPIPQPSLKPRARAAVVAFVDVVDWLRRRAGRLDIVNLLVELLDKLQFQAYLAKEYGQDEAEDRWLNVQELVAAAAPFVESHIQEEQFSAFLDDVALLTDADVAGEGDDVVKLMTLHKAKGLEFPKVWLPGVEEELLPYHRAETEEDIAEERRLFFVGVTRAMRQLVISATMYRRLYQERHPAQASHFLEAIPEELLVIG